MPRARTIESATTVAHAGTWAAPAAEARAQTRLAAWARRCSVLLPPLGFVVGGAALAVCQGVEAAPETAYLTLLGGWTLGGAALLAPARSRIGAAAALFAAMALWALPAGP